MVTIVIWIAVNYHEDNQIDVVKFRKDFFINPFCQKVKHQMSVVKAMVSAFICNSITTICTSLSQSSLPPLSQSLSSLLTPSSRLQSSSSPSTSLSRLSSRSSSSPGPTSPHIGGQGQACAQSHRRR